MQRFLGFFVVLGLAGVLPAQERPNLLLITVDTLRADRIERLGADFETPASSRLARDGFLFTQAITTSTVTLPSHSSMMTGRLPYEHHVHDNIGYRLGDDQLTLAEILSERGYKTSAFVGAFVLAKNFGINQGFETYDDDFSMGFSNQREKLVHESVGHCTQVWRIQTVPPGSTTVKLAARHAAPGPEGEFAYTLIADDDGDGRPDRYLDRSTLYQSEAGQWTWHCFSLPQPLPPNLFAGLTWPKRNPKTIPYATVSGTLSDWENLDPSAWFARENLALPNQHTQGPRACDLRISFLDTSERLTGRAGVFDRELNAANGLTVWPGVDVDRVERRAEVCVDRALSWLDNATQLSSPWFLWIHVFDPHMVYDPPEPFRSRFADRPYDGEVAYAENQLMRLLTFLDQKGIYDRTAILYAADHGENLGERGAWGHGMDVYEPCLHVPYIVKPPSRQEGVRIDNPVSLVSVAPTALVLLGETPPPEMTGLPLLQVNNSDGWGVDTTALPAVTYSETYRYERPYKGGAMLGFRTDRWKLVTIPRDAYTRLFDLLADRAELHPVEDAPPIEIQEMVQRIPEFLDTGQTPPSEREITNQERESLKALGYF